MKLKIVFKKGFDKMKKFMMSEEAFDELINGFEYVGNLTKYGKENIKYHVQRLQQKNKNLEQALDENNKLKIQISARETLCEEYEQLINTILNFSFFKEECPLNFSFEDNSKEDKAQNIFYNDEYCENNCNDNYKDCWLKYFKELQKTKGDVKNEN